MNPDQYSYQDAGFDNFLSRSIDATPQVNLDSSTPPINTVAFDRTQITGYQGDTWQMGPVRITKTGLFMQDENGNDIFMMANE